VWSWIGFSSSRHNWLFGPSQGHIYVLKWRHSRDAGNSGDFDDNEPACRQPEKRIAVTAIRSQPDPDVLQHRIWVFLRTTKIKAAAYDAGDDESGADHQAAGAGRKWIAYSSQLDRKAIRVSTKQLAVVPGDRGRAGAGDAQSFAWRLDRMATQPKFAPAGTSVYFIADGPTAHEPCAWSRLPRKR